MCFFIFKRVKKNYVANQVFLTFPSSKGEVKLRLVSVKMQNGLKGVRYDSFLLAIGKWTQQVMSEDDFIEDIKKVINLVTKGLSNQEVMKSLLKEHISQKGRLIDADLCSYISELYLVLSAVYGSCNRHNLLDQMMQVAEQNFEKYFYITQYRHTGYGLQPYLVSFKDFMANI